MVKGSRIVAVVATGVWLHAQTTAPSLPETLQAKRALPNSVGVPKPAMDLAPGTCKYNATAVQPDVVPVDQASGGWRLP
jgi:hypothetical protein